MNKKTELCALGCGPCYYYKHGNYNYCDEEGISMCLLRFEGEARQSTKEEDYGREATNIQL